MIVDSTRFGKAFPDSFNRTVPLWCAVLNRSMGFTDAAIELPRWLPVQERTRISETQLNEWAKEVTELASKSGIVLKSAFRLKPFWICNDKMAWNRNANDLEVLTERLNASEGECIPIVCVSASAVIDAAVHREQHSWHYIPGAADDEENWAGGLTSEVFWANREELLSANNGTGCEDIVGRLARDSKLASATQIPGLGARLNTCGINSLLSIVWSDPQGGSIACGAEKARPNKYDASWIKGQDKAWGRRNPSIWPERALPEALGAFATREDPSASFIIRGEDLETVATLAVAILAVFFDDQCRHARAVPLQSIIDKTRLRSSEGFVVSLVSQEALAIPRRLVKELIEFFAAIKWTQKVAWSKSDEAQ
jgi:hypothetical protein